jgi:cellulose biosynthesis protein BcsQ
VGRQAAGGATGQLLVDADPQFGLTRAFGKAPSQAPATLLDVMMGEATVDAAVLHSVAAGVDLLASHRDLKRLELRHSRRSACRSPRRRSLS